MQPDIQQPPWYAKLVIAAIVALTRLSLRPPRHMTDKRNHDAVMKELKRLTDGFFCAVSIRSSHRFKTGGCGSVQ